MHRDLEQPTTRYGRSDSAGPAVEDHGRVVTTNNRAAAFYRQAQRAGDPSATVRALRHAVIADPGFGLAVVDLGAFTEAPPSHIGGRPMSWERHHIEVVHTAAAGNFSRAADLLHEHLASVGCDPLALRVVIDLRRRIGDLDGLEDFSAQFPGCHSSLSETEP